MNASAGRALAGWVHVWARARGRARGRAQVRSHPKCLDMASVKLIGWSGLKAALHGIQMHGSAAA